MDKSNLKSTHQPFHTWTMQGIGKITTFEVAKQLGVSRRAVLALVSRGVLEPVAKLPGCTGAYLFDQSQINHFISDRATRIGKRNESAI